MQLSKKSKKSRFQSKFTPQSIDSRNFANAAEKKIENLKLVASLVEWSSYDKIMGKIFYEKFGKVLEQKVDAFQSTKSELKAYIRENYANHRAMQTPRKAKPATALLEQINKFKELNFDSDDENELSERESPESVIAAHVPDLIFTPAAPTVTNTPATPAVATTTPAVPTTPTPAVPTTPTPAVPTIPSTPITPFTPKFKKFKPGTPHGIVCSSKTAVGSVQMPPILNLFPVKNTLDTTFQKVRKLQQMDEKADQAMKAREEQLREKAERAKREREERAKRVEQNNRRKEEERLERENNCRKHLEAVKEFQERELLTSQKQKYASPVVQSHILKHFSVQSKKNTPKTPNINNKPATVRKSKDFSTSKCTEIPIPQFTLEENAEKIENTDAENNYNVDDLSSGDDTDNDEQPRKLVPKWAMKENILASTHEIRHLLTRDQMERHFGRIKQPNVYDLFKGYRKNYPPRRASSTCWDSPMSDPTPGVGLFQSKFNIQSTSKINALGK